MEHFPKAPIHEALLDIQVILPPGTEAGSLKAFGEGIEERFPDRQERISIVQSLQLAEGQPQIPPAKNVEGYLFTSKAGGKIAQARMEGFTFNKLRPYSKWEEFNTEAKELWQRYATLAKPVAVKRLGLRYINRIEIPETMKDLREICFLFPDVPKGVPQVWAEFFQRFVSPEPDEAVSIVTLALDVPARPPARPAIILDIDVARGFENVVPDTESMWETFEKLRALKNGIFDASLSPQAKALFR